MPRFPHAQLQTRFIGSADEHALREGFNFYQHVKGYSAALGMPLRPSSKVLDFGSGWGRYPRLFWNDVDEENLFGVDVDQDVLAVCRGIGTPGRFFHIDPVGPLPFEDGFFDLIVSYSVFSHLPEPVARHWMRELSRVAKSGCVFAYTTEPRRFLDFILDIPSNTSNDWHAALGRFKSEIPGLLARFDEGQFCYLSTSGGQNLDRDVYGDAAVPERYIREEWAEFFRLMAYIDDPDRFWQAFVVVQKP
jgi:hypothetical protein